MAKQFLEVLDTGRTTSVNSPGGGAPLIRKIFSIKLADTITIEINIEELRSEKEQIEARLLEINYLLTQVTE